MRRSSIILYIQVIVFAYADELESGSDQNVESTTEWNPDNEAWRYTTAFPGQTLSAEATEEDSDLKKDPDGQVNMANPFKIDLVPYNFWTGNMWEDGDDKDDEDDENSKKGDDKNQSSTASTKTTTQAATTAAPAVKKVDAAEAKKISPMSDMIQSRLKAGRRYLTNPKVAPTLATHHGTSANI